MNRLARGAALVLAGVIPLAAQERAFEVASVKVNRAGPTAPQRVSLDAGDHVVFTNVQARTLIQVAYGGIDIEGEPDWVGRGPAGDRFDVDGKAGAAASRAELVQMLRTLLADRFKLTGHTESRPQKLHALVVARRDGRLGPGLRPTPADCATLTEQAVADRRRDPCGLGQIGNAGITGQMSVRGLTVAQLAGLLTREVRTRVTDRTGLTGAFDWELKWTPQQFARPDLDRQRFPTIDPNGPTIFDALEDQLGLKLHAEDGAVDVLVIDYIERPMPN
jgi:uncharacterized protein (TIGR03435 family)